MKKLFLLSHVNADAIAYWSGTPFHIRKVLQTKYELYEISPGDNRFLKFVYKVQLRLKKILGLRYNFHYSFLFAILQAPYIYYHLVIKHRSKSNQILALACIPELIFIPSRFKVTLFADAVFSQILDNYEPHINLWHFSVKESNALSHRALKRANHIVFSSRWAQAQAIKEGCTTESNSSIGLLGANISDHFNNEIIGQRINNEPLRLLFPSTNWDRKGGELALKIIECLAKETKRPIVLVIFGNSPKNVHPTTFKIEALGLLNKLNPIESQDLINTYIHTDFMIVPSKSDCTPVSICEAMCYGIPVLATPVGGIPEMLFNQESSYLIDSNKVELAVAWIRAREKNDLYKRTAEVARKEYEITFNWEKWYTHLDTVLA